MRIKGIAKVITVLAMVGSFSIPALATAVEGARSGRFRIKAGETHTFRAAFYGGELASVLVLGDGDTDLDVYVYDAAGKPVAVDDDYTDACFVEWKPRWTGTFTIKVVNRGRVYNDYSIEWD